MVSVCIVGHGRSPEGQGWGQKIDACQYVIRMWDHTWQDPVDYGIKYDIGLVEAHTSYMEQWCKHNRREPDLFWIGSVVSQSPMHMNAVPKNTEMFDQLNWVDLGQRMGGCGNTGQLRYTRGTLAALWAIERIEPDELYLVGFDSVKMQYAQPTDEAFSKTYQKNPGTFTFTAYDKTVSKDGSTTKHGNHDYVVERPVLEYLADKHNVKLIFAQDVWEHSPPTG